MKKLFSLTTLNIVLLAALLCIAAGLLLKPGLPSGHDTYAHATYSKIFIHSLQHGQLPVRWVEHAWIGFGQPIFNYYQVGYLYLVSTFYLIIPTITGATKATVLFIWLMGTAFTYAFTRKYSHPAATTASIVYALSPYILLDVFVRSSFPELTALSLIPGIFWAIDRLITTKKPLYIPILAVLIGITFISHLPTVVLFSPLVAIYTLYSLFEKRSPMRIFYYLCTAGLLGIGLSAFYVLPAVTELEHIQIEKMQTGQFNYNVNFVKPDNVFSYIWGYNGEWWGTYIPHAYVIGMTPWLIIAIATAYLLFVIFKHRKISWHLLFWLFCITYAYFFMNKISAPIWQAIPIFSFFQFPWRFFMLIPISTAVLTAILLQKITTTRYQVTVTLITFFITAVSTIPFINAQQFLSVDYFNLPFNQWRQDPMAQYVAFWEPGYSPAGVDYTPQKTEFTQVWSLSGEGRVTERSINPHEIVVSINATDQSTFTLNTPYFPYWQAYLNNQLVEITPADPYNFMNITIPPGEHNLQVTFVQSTLVSTANAVSLTTFITIVLMISYFLISPNFRTDPTPLN